MKKWLHELWVTFNENAGIMVGAFFIGLVLSLIRMAVSGPISAFMSHLLK